MILWVSFRFWAISSTYGVPMSHFSEQRCCSVPRPNGNGAAIFTRVVSIAATCACPACCISRPACCAACSQIQRPSSSQRTSDGNHCASNDWLFSPQLHRKPPVAVWHKIRNRAVAVNDEPQRWCLHPTNGIPPFLTGFMPFEGKQPAQIHAYKPVSSGPPEPRMIQGFGGLTGPDGHQSFADTGII